MTICPWQISLVAFPANFFGIIMYQSLREKQMKIRISQYGIMMITPGTIIQRSEFQKYITSRFHNTKAFRKYFFRLRNMFERTPADYHDQNFYQEPGAYHWRWLVPILLRFPSLQDRDDLRYQELSHFLLPVP